MREFNESAHRHAAPMPPDAHALARVRGEALVRSARSAARPKGWVALVVAGAVCSVLVAGAASLGLVGGIPGVPGMKKPEVVFAKARALESLAPPTHGVMHTRRSSNPPAAGAMITQVTDMWFDLDAKAYRGETRGVDGKLLGLAVQRGGRMTSLSCLDPFTGVAAPSKGSKTAARHKYELMTVAHQPTPEAKDDYYYLMASEIRATLDSGEATITGPIDYRGTQCWAVDYGDVLDGKPRLRGLLRTGDYSLIGWQQSLGAGSPPIRMEFEHETLDRQTLASDFFSLEVPGRAVPAKQIVKRQHIDLSSQPPPERAIDPSKSVSGD